MTAGTVDVYGLQILDATLETGNTAEEDAAGASSLTEGPTTSRHPGRGAAGAHAHHAKQFSGALQQPELRGLGQLHGGRLPAGGLLVLAEPCSSSFLGQQVGARRPPGIQGRQHKLLFGATKLLL